MRSAVSKPTTSTQTEKDETMRKQFLVTWEGTFEADPETDWHAITEGTAGWLWKIDYEPR